MSSEERNYGSQNHQKCNQGDKHCVRNRSTQHPKGGVTGSRVARMVAVVMKGITVNKEQDRESHGI